MTSCDAGARRTKVASPPLKPPTLPVCCHRPKSMRPELEPGSGAIANLLHVARRPGNDRIQIARKDVGVRSYILSYAPGRIRIKTVAVLLHGGASAQLRHIGTFTDVLIAPRRPILDDKHKGAERSLTFQTDNA
jgi:hypothetical protein